MLTKIAINTEFPSAISQIGTSTSVPVTASSLAASLWLKRHQNEKGGQETMYSRKRYQSAYHRIATLSILEAVNNQESGM